MTSFGFDPRQVLRSYRNALGSFATGVTVVTTRRDDVQHLAPRLRSGGGRSARPTLDSIGCPVMVVSGAQGGAAPAGHLATLGARHLALDPCAHLSCVECAETFTTECGAFLL